RDASVMPMHATYVDTAGLLRSWADSKAFGFNVYYYAWTKAAARMAVRLHREVGFSVAQHVSLSRWWMPSPAAVLASRGVPFVWGPVGAGEVMPLAYRGGIGLGGHIKEISRWLARETFRLDPGLRRCARAATVGVAVPDESVRRLRALGVERVARSMSLPCDVDAMTDVVPVDKPDGLFRIVSGGGATYWKVLHLAIRAFAEAFRDVPNTQYVHVCGGPQLPRLQRAAERLGIADRVHLVGEKPHTENLRWVKTADIYALTAMRDSSAHLYEAIAAGVPCVVSDLMSGRVVIDETCGRRVPIVGGPAQFVETMAKHFRELFDDAELRKRLGDGARQRAIEFGTEAYVKRTDELFSDVIRQARSHRVVVGGDAAEPPARTLAGC
ncbi:MAG: glycosyltransferase, partial [Planctomycetota bacterium]